jgi:hypothetical protein
MTKIQIIDIDLGTDLDKIILNCTKDLTREARDQLDGAIAMHIQAKQMKEQKTTEKKEKTTKISTILDRIYNDLIAAGSTGLPADDILLAIAKDIPTSSAFTLRMNKYIASKGNPFRLVRIKKDKTHYYMLESFNEALPTTS